MSDPTPWILQVISGATGGNLVGAMRGPASLGPFLNSMVGAASGAVLVQGLILGDAFGPVVAAMGGNHSLAGAVAATIGGMAVPLGASFFQRGS
jgi:hypothetical protein